MNWGMTSQSKVLAAPTQHVARMSAFYFCTCFNDVCAILLGDTVRQHDRFNPPYGVD